MRKNLFFLLTLNLMFLILSCNSDGSKKSEPEIDDAKIIQQIKSLSTLGSVEYSFSKLIKCSDEQTFSIGDRKLLMSCKAYVKAGVDFEKISIPNIDVKNKSIEILLPKGEIILMSIPAEDIKIINEQTGAFRDKFSNNEIQKIQVLAEKEIKQKLAEFNITDKAESNAQIFLDKWVRTFGFKSVKISVK
jgi:hypothetical protein